ncbi:MAG: chorismate mutase [Treponema sp.]|nr:chorismate mutase [Treponema sp.]
MAAARKRIDSIDDEIAALFLQRLKAVDDAARAKRALGTAVRDETRELEILKRIAKNMPPDARDDAEKLFKAIFSISRDRQRPAP